MAELLFADAHLAGDFPNPDDALGDDTGTWAGPDLNTNSSATSRWSMTDPVDPLTAAATQTIRVHARRGSNSGIPSITVSLYESGTLVQAIGNSSVNSQTGADIAFTFNTADVTSGADVEIEIVMTGAGGSPSVRNAAQVARISWTADTTEAADPPGSGNFPAGDVTTVGWTGTAAAAAGFSAADVVDVGWTAERATAASFTVVDTATVGWTGQAPSVGGATGGFDVTDQADVGWTGAAAASAAFLVGDAATVGWTGTVAAAGVYPVGDEVTVTWSGLAPTLPGAGGGYTIGDITTVGWTGQRAAAAGFILGDATTLEWSGQRSAAGGYTIAAVATTAWSGQQSGAASIPVVAALGMYDPVALAVGRYATIILPEGSAP